MDVHEWHYDNPMHEEVCRAGSSIQTQFHGDLAQGMPPLGAEEDSGQRGRQRPNEARRINQRNRR